MELSKIQTLNFFDFRSNTSPQKISILAPYEVFMGTTHKGSAENYPIFYSFIGKLEKIFRDYSINIKPILNIIIYSPNVLSLEDMCLELENEFSYCLTKQAIKYGQVELIKGTETLSVLALSEELYRLSSTYLARKPPHDVLLRDIKYSISIILREEEGGRVQTLLGTEYCIDLKMQNLPNEANGHSEGCLVRNKNIIEIDRKTVNFFTPSWMDLIREEI